MATVVERDVVKGGQPLHRPRRSRATERERLPLGPLKTIHVYWLAGMSCDGCTISVAGATNPGIEGLLAGVVPAMPKVILHHPVLSVEAGAEFVKSFRDAWRRHARRALRRRLRGLGGRRAYRRRAPAATSARWASRRSRTGKARSPVPTATWLQRLAPGAAATIAIGTCATWGGVPSAEGNPTGAMSVMDFLGKDYRSAFGCRSSTSRAARPRATTSPRRSSPSCCSSRASGRCRRSTSSGGRRGSSATPSTRAARAPASTRRASSPSTTATRSASSRSAAGGRSSTATSCSAAPSTTWAAA